MISAYQWADFEADQGKRFGLETGNKIKTYKTHLGKSWVNHLRLEPPALRFLGSCDGGI